MKRMTKFSLRNYTAGFIERLPTTVLPILITNSNGAKFSAYFYMDIMIAHLLCIIPMANPLSLFAEGSFSEIELKVQINKVIKIISLLLVHAILVIFLFGKEYSYEGFILLNNLSISAILIIINAILGAILNIK